MGIMEFPPAAGELVVDAAGIPVANPSDLAAFHSAQNTPIAPGVGAAESINEANATTGPETMTSPASRVPDTSASADSSISEDGGAAVNTLASEDDTVAVSTKAAEKDGAAAAEVATDGYPTPEIDSEAAAELVQQSSKMVSYHRNADTYIRIRESTSFALYYKVCFTLVAAGVPAISDCFTTMKRIASFTGKLVFDLPEFGDDSDGLDIILSIVHYKFHEIPGRPDVDLLYSVAKVVEKFDCSHLLVPYMEKWMAGLDWHIVMKKEHNDDDKTLFLTWVFGERRWFAQMVSRVAHTATLDDEENLLDARSQPWKNQNISPVILELITKTRYNGLVKIVRAVDEPLRELMTGTQDSLKFCRSKDTNKELRQSCQHQQLGSLVSALSANGLLPFPTANEYRGSVVDLAKKVRTIKVLRFKLPGTPPHLDGHINCGINHEEAVENALTEEVQLTGEIMEQLKLRAQKSGAFTPELFKEGKNTDGRATSPGSIIEDLRLDHVHYKQVTDDVVTELNAGDGYTETEIKIEDIKA